jgi:hypothetical protein
MKILQHVSESRTKHSSAIPMTADRITETWPEESSSLPMLGNSNGSKGYQRVINMYKCYIKVVHEACNRKLVQSDTCRALV